MFTVVDQLLYHPFEKIFSLKKFSYTGTLLRESALKLRCVCVGGKVTKQPR